jgi:hypothetical protein
MTNNSVSTRTPAAPLLWVVLIISAAVNAGGPLVGLGVVPRMIAGGIAIAAIAGLVIQHLRRRKA